MNICNFKDILKSLPAFKVGNREEGEYATSYLTHRMKSGSKIFNKLPIYVDFLWDNGTY